MKPINIDCAIRAETVSHRDCSERSPCKGIALEWKQVWLKLRRLISFGMSLGLFGLCGFLLLLIKNQSNNSLLYVICTATITYAFVLFAEYKQYGQKPRQIIEIVPRTRLLFRWIYVAVYLTALLIHMIHAGWHSGVDTTNGRNIYLMVMFVFVALTIPRDIMLRKASAWIKQKWLTKAEKK